jgi:hypothetical protein
MGETTLAPVAPLETPRAVTVWGATIGNAALIENGHFDSIASNHPNDVAATQNSLTASGRFLNVSADEQHSDCGASGAELTCAEKRRGRHLLTSLISERVSTPSPVLETLAGAEACLHTIRDSLFVIDLLGLLSLESISRLDRSEDAAILRCNVIGSDRIGTEVDGVALAAARGSHSHLGARVDGAPP